MGISVGIDLGTTYSAVATFDKASGTIRMLKNDIGEECTPSVVCIDGSAVSIGAEAKDQQAAGNVDTAAFYKSMMGDANFSAYIGGKSYSAEALSGIYLKKLKQIIEQANGVKIDSAVITVPAYFNEAQRLATQRAGETAGIKVLKLINEPTAAIIAYGLTGIGEKNVMVYDLGGGTFDVTIARIRGSSVDVLATNGNHQLGGKDWDAAITEEVRDRFMSQFGIDVFDYEDVVKELSVKSEKAKKNLSNVPSTQISVLCDGYSGKYEITKEFFENATAVHLEETMMLVGKCFEEISKQTGKRFGWNSLDEVVLVGGSTRMPQISAAISAAFGKQPIIIGSKVDTIVAAGAAMQASICNEGSITLSASSGFIRTQGGAPAGATLTISGDSIKDVTSHSLGMMVFENERSAKPVNSIIIPKNSFIGVGYSKWYTSYSEDVESYVMQGESTDPFCCTFLYKYIIHGLPKNGKGKFEATYFYNQSGIVELTAKDDGGRMLKVTKAPETRSLEQIISVLIADREKELMRKPECNITFVVDTSGSMSGSPIQEARSAVDQFLSQLDGVDTTASIINFAERCTWECREEKNLSRIRRAISNLVCDGKNGCCTSARPLSEIKGSIGAFDDLGGRIIVVLTDGEWSEQGKEISAAEELKRRGATVYAIGIGEADSDFLNRIASQGGAQKIDISKLTSTFRNIASNIATQL